MNIHIFDPESMSMRNLPEEFNAIIIKLIGKLLNSESHHTSAGAPIACVATQKHIKRLKYVLSSSSIVMIRTNNNRIELVFSAKQEGGQTMHV